jgi:hypothetical protein
MSNEDFGEIIDFMEILYNTENHPALTNGDYIAIYLLIKKLKEEQGRERIES